MFSCTLYCVQLSFETSMLLTDPYLEIANAKKRIYNFPTHKSLKALKKNPCHQELERKLFCFRRRCIEFKRKDQMSDNIEKG